LLTVHTRNNPKYEGRDQNHNYDTGHDSEDPNRPDVLRCELRDTLRNLFTIDERLNLLRSEACKEQMASLLDANVMLLRDANLELVQLIETET
jgi:hypothetical protein